MVSPKKQSRREGLEEVILGKNRRNWSMGLGRERQRRK